LGSGRGRRHGGSSCGRRGGHGCECECGYGCGWRWRWRLGSLGGCGSRRRRGAASAAEERQQEQPTDDAKAEKSARPGNCFSTYHDCSDLRQGISNSCAYYSTFASIRPLFPKAGTRSDLSLWGSRPIALAIFAPELGAIWAPLIIGKSV